MGKQYEAESKLEGPATVLKINISLQIRFHHFLILFFMILLFCDINKELPILLGGGQQHIWKVRSSKSSYCPPPSSKKPVFTLKREETRDG